MKNVLCAMWQPQASLLEEIYDFGSSHNWQIELCGRRLPPGWSGNGIITDYLQPNELRLIRNFEKTPIVSRELPPGGNIRTVACDTALMANLIVDYFRSKGFRHFAAVDAREWSGVFDGRWLDPVVALREELQRYDLTLEVCYWNPEQRSEELTDYGLIMKKLSRFFRGLPKPVALFVPNGMYLAVVYRVLHALKIKVPEEIAVLCNTDNAMITEKASIPTTRINGELREVGRKMAELLHRMMNREVVSERAVYVTASAIVSQRSTDVLAVPDVKLATAVSFLLRNYMNFISVEDAARAAGISPSMLNRLFRKHLDKTPVAFLQELRLNRIRDLLDGTELPLPEIARQTGYGSSMSLSLAFKRAEGMTPGAYRLSRRKR